MPKGDWLVDAEEIKERMCIGEKFFRNHIVKDSRMKAIEIKKQTENPGGHPTKQKIYVYK